jgi:glycosyltransferase involved in cell wall biosynthesis
MYPHARLVMVGKGYPGDSENSEEKVKELIDKLRLNGRVIMTGYREDVPDVLQSFDVFCLPSLSEGLPVSILEAMAARIPVVGSNVRGINEVVSSGETGLLFPSNDDKALSQTLESLIREDGLRTDLRQRAFAFLSQSHSLGQWVLSYELLFQSICLKGDSKTTYPPE